MPGVIDAMGMADAGATVTVNNQSVERAGEYYRKELMVENMAGPVQTQVSVVAAKAGTADVTRWIYDEATGLLRQKQDAAVKGASYTYDVLGRVRTWARGVATTYAYDANTGEMTGVDYADATPDVSFAYDRGGRQKTITDAAGLHTRSFTERGELKTDQISGGLLDMVQVSTTYDSLLRRQFLQAARGASVLMSQTYGYDPSARLETITSNGQTATYAYDAPRGLLNTTTFTGGTQLSRSYDSLGRLQMISTTTPAVGTVASYSYTYNNLHQRTKVTREDGSYWAYGYNDRGELLSGKKSWADNTLVFGQQTEYAYDNLGNRSVAKSGGNQLGQLRQSAYTANSLNQYVQRSVPGAVDVTGTANSAATVSVNDEATARKGDYFYKELAVENSGGPVSAQVNVVGARQNFGAGGEDAVTEQGGRAFVPSAVETMAYDADGNLTLDGRWTYSWDAENRLVSMEAIASVPAEAKQKLEFAYDYMGRRVLKRVYNWSSVTISYQLTSVSKFVYDGWDLVAELNGNNAPVRSYVWGGDELLLVNEAGSSYQVGYDGNENVTSLVNAGLGTIAAAYEYDPFGNILRATGEYASKNPLRFSSKYTDQETGLLYYGYRYYNSQSGRWIGRDPIEEVDGINLYGFVGNDPIGKIDVLGLFTDQDIKESRVSYSCKCGWIDWDHVAVGSSTNLDRGPNKGSYSAWSIWDKISNERAEEQSLTKAGYKVSAYQQRNFKIKFSYYGGQYFVRSPMGFDQKKSVALAMFMEVSEKKEGSFPNLSGSNFSEEDLPSNLISFYAAVNNYTRRDITRVCSVQDPELSLEVWKNTKRTLTQNRTWKPVDHNKDSCCTDKKLVWPNELETITPAMKGYYWRDWKEGVDWQREKRTIWDRR